MDITINAPSAAGEVNFGRNVGVNNNKTDPTPASTNTGYIYKQKLGTELQFKSIVAGTGMGIVDDGSNIIFTPAVVSGTSPSCFDAYLVQAGTEDNLLTYADLLTAANDGHRTICILVDQPTGLNVPAGLDFVFHMVYNILGGIIWMIGKRKRWVFL